MRAVFLAIALVGGTPSLGQETTGPAEVRTLLSSGKWREALAQARRAGSATPETRAALAEALFRAGELEECGTLLAAHDPFDEAVTTARAQTVLARLAAAEGRRTEAGALADRAVGRAPEDAEVVYWAGDVHPDRARSKQLLERFLTLPGADPRRLDSVRQALAWMTTIGDRRIWVAVASPEHLELPLEKIVDRDGTTTGFVVTARLGERDRPVRLLLDTGTHGVYLVERLAKKSGFVELAERESAGGVVKKAKGKRGTVPTLALAGLVYRDALITTTPRDLDPYNRFHGLVGISPFGGYRITLDLAKGRLVLDAEAAGLDGGSPYWWVSGQLLLRVAVAGDSGPRTGLFVLDTGASLSAVGKQIGSVEGTRTTVTGIGGTATSWRTSSEIAFEVLGARRSSTPLVLDLTTNSQLGGVEVTGLLGLDVLGGGVLEIDSRAQRIRRR